MFFSTNLEKNMSIGGFCSILFQLVRRCQNSPLVSIRLELEDLVTTRFCGALLTTSFPNSWKRS